MVDITRCERCGRVIPATDSGCAYCETPDQGLQERPYLPLAVRMLLWLFGASLVAAMILGVATAMAQLGGESFAGSLLVLLGVLRALLATASLGAIVMREPWGRYPPLVFLTFELLMVTAMIVGLVPAGSWEGGLVAPLWNVLFVFLFLREDVQTSFEPRLRDRKDLSELLRVVEKGEHDR